MEIKARIPDEPTLQALLLADLDKTTESVKNKIGGLEQDYVSFRRKRRLVGLALFLIFSLPPLFFFVFGTLVSDTVSALSGIIGTIIFIVSFWFFVYIGTKLLISGSATMKEFHARIDKILFNKIFSLLQIDGELIEQTSKISEDKKTSSKFVRMLQKIKHHLELLQPSEEALEMLEILRESELITEPFNTTKVDNLFCVNIPESGRQLFVGEFDIKNVTGSGKNRQVNNIFHGYFASYQLPHVLDGKTFISTEGDENGFGHRSFWSFAKENLPSETTFEWGDFEEMLHVATTDKVEARYILTPDFMSDLYDWWQLQKGNIRISFIGNRMYLLYPDNQVRVHDTVANIDEKEVREYMMTIARPLLHILHLVEDVRMT